MGDPSCTTAKLPVSTRNIKKKQVSQINVGDVEIFSITNSTKKILDEQSKAVNFSVDESGFVELILIPKFENQNNKIIVRDLDNNIIAQLIINKPNTIKLPLGVFKIGSE